MKRTALFVSIAAIGATIVWHFGSQNSITIPKHVENSADEAPTGYEVRNEKFDDNDVDLSTLKNISADDQGATQLSMPIDPRQNPRLSAWVTEYAARTGETWVRDGFANVDVGIITNTINLSSAESMQDISEESIEFNLALFPDVELTMRVKRFSRPKGDNAYSMFTSIIDRNGDPIGKGSIFYSAESIHNRIDIRIFGQNRYYMAHTGIGNTFFVYEPTPMAPIAID